MYSTVCYSCVQSCLSYVCIYCIVCIDDNCNTTHTLNQILYDPNHKKQDSINMIVIIKHKTKSNAMQNNIITDVSNDKHCKTHGMASNELLFSCFHSFDCILILRITCSFHMQTKQTLKTMTRFK